MFDWRKVQRLVIPEGVVRRITYNGIILWGHFVSLGRTAVNIGPHVLATLKDAMRAALRGRWLAQRIDKAKALLDTGLQNCLAGRKCSRLYTFAKAAVRGVKQISLERSTWMLNLCPHTHTAAGLKRPGFAVVLKLIVSIPNRWIAPCKFRLPERVRTLIQAFHGKSAVSGWINRVTEMLRLRAFSGESVVSRWMNLDDTKFRLVLNTDGTSAAAKLGAALGGAVKTWISTALLCGAKIIASAWQMVRLIIKAPDEMRAMKKPQARDRHFTFASTGAAFSEETQSNIQSKRRLAGNLCSAENSLRATVRKCITVVMAVPKSLMSAWSRTISRIVKGAVKSILSTHIGQMNHAPATSVCRSAVSMALWESPVQTGSNLHITQAYAVQRTDNKIQIS